MVGRCGSNRSVGNTTPLPIAVLSGCKRSSFFAAGARSNALNRGSATTLLFGVRTTNLKSLASQCSASSGNDKAGRTSARWPTSSHRRIQSGKTTSARSQSRPGSVARNSARDSTRPTTIISRSWPRLSPTDWHHGGCQCVSIQKLVLHGACLKVKRQRSMLVIFLLGGLGSKPFSCFFSSTLSGLIG